MFAGKVYTEIFSNMNKKSVQNVTQIQSKEMVQSEVKNASNA